VHTPTSFSEVILTIQRLREAACPVVVRSEDVHLVAPPRQLRGSAHHQPLCAACRGELIHSESMRYSAHLETGSGAGVTVAAASQLQCCLSLPYPEEFSEVAHSMRAHSKRKQYHVKAKKEIRKIITAPPALPLSSVHLPWTSAGHVPGRLYSE